METVTERLRVATFNCNGFKGNSGLIKNLCDNHDIIFLQELMLLEHDLHLLNRMHSEFIGRGFSPVDVSSNLLTGRPYGGLGCLYRKSLASSIEGIKCLDKRVMQFSINTAEGVVVFLNVYMPTEYNDDLSLISYCETIGCIDSALELSSSNKIIIIGDWNAKPGSRFFAEVRELCVSHNLILSDIKVAPPGKKWDFQKKLSKMSFCHISIEEVVV